MALGYDYDLVVQFRLDVAQDAQKRSINSSILNDLAINSPISRVIDQTVPSFRVKAHWAEPRLDISGDFVNLSVDVDGGVRNFLSGINLTMGGRSAPLAE
jgi:hypothetical protein